MGTKLMTFSMCSLDDLRESFDAAFVDSIQEESCTRAVLREGLEDFWRIDIRAIVESKGDNSWDNAVR